MEAYHRDIAAK